ncbi:MAG: 50S ribosome-binding GTPase [Candidatus Micrarchaeota archaeon]|nr:50S ribosome-binding GTPase [Candidatus Micrarchaeota archaeon]
MVDKSAAQKKIDELQEQYSKTKYNKATNKYLGELRAKIAKIKHAIESTSRKAGTGYSVRKTGNATVVFVGFPNAGKSSLLKALTGVDSKVADYAFTTLDVIPGMLEYNGAKIQMLDLPGLIQGAHIGKGGSMKIISVVRIADLILFVVDINTYGNLYQLIDELNMLNIRVNRRKPKMRLEITKSGGVNVEANGHLVPKKDVVAGVLNEFKIFNGEVIFYENVTEDMLIDFVADNCVYMRGVVALNKIDTVGATVVDAITKEIEAKTGMTVMPISAKMFSNIPELKKDVFESLDLIRVYLKPKEGNPDMEKPLVLDKNSTVIDVVKKINTKLVKDARFAYVTGPSSKFANQRVGVEHIVKDGDIVTIIFD